MISSEGEACGVRWWVMRAEKRRVWVLALVCLGSFAGAVHAEDAWRKTMAVAAFPDVNGKDDALVAQATPPVLIAEGTDLKRAFGPQRSAHTASAGLPELIANPYDAAADNVSLPTARDGAAFDKRADETGSDERWSNPYVIARNTDNDERWSNPYVVARNVANDERWANPYGVARNVANDERWSNPYAPSVRH